jgi:DNA topoisomerase-1
MAAMQDWEARALSAGLAYIQNFDSGFTRKKFGKGFKFVDADGKPVKCPVTRERIVRLVIPPAWKEVWICPDENGHIQATGIDEAGRKQYIYHPRWHEASAAYKYGRLKSFAALLPRIRRQVLADLKDDDLSKTRVVAAVVRLLDKACFRIGNRQYLMANDSRGATTLTAEHVSRCADGITFKFKGKSGKQIELVCDDEHLAKVIEDCQKSDGEFLFSYQNDNGEYVPVTSADVNAYLLEAAGEYVTAKDFRTWRGSVVAFSKLINMPDNLSKTKKKKFIADAVKAASTCLANTPAVCRSSYIHSAILDFAEEDRLAPLMREMDVKATRRTGLNQHEIKLVAFLNYIESAKWVPTPKPPKQVKALKQKAA